MALFAIGRGIQTGGVTLYLATPKADCLSVSFISENWDLDGLEAYKQETVDNNLLKIGFLGAKLGLEEHLWS